ncbi:hypothetical protein EFA46_012690 (plasmid) [Halarchaeum sp. CBA1220]|uniref:hypothetical protein n=1 Tax=Halarchaeum sp. CBA1220 TaxID=1853682 RepID=UPI0011CD5AB0|nr:hypothetical protein [Halarchaeum sp. CBA1220]QLC35107.1 hypothetical protein EFA46_012690 [Halarchaeum sp. CBA1220]
MALTIKDSLGERAPVKIVIIALVWAILLSWFIRVYPSMGNPGLVGGYGATHDWGRFHIATTGTIQQIPDPITSVSSRMIVRPDISAILLAIISVISGKTGLGPGLRLLLSIPNLSYFLLALIGVSVHRRMNRNSGLYSIVLIFIYGLFISGIFIDFTKHSLLYAGYGLCFYSLVLYIMYRINLSGFDRRWILLLFACSSVVMMVYHTIALLALFIIPSFYIIEYITSIVRPALQRRKHESIYIRILAISFIVVSVGLYYSGIISELVIKLTWFFVNSSQKAESLSAAKTSVFYASLSFGQNPLQAVSSISKVMLRAGYVLVIIYFMYLIVGRDRNQNTVFIIMILSLYPVVFIMYYSYGGIGVGVRRTAAAGTPVLMFIIPYILTKIRGIRLKRAMYIFIGALVVLSVATQAPIIHDTQRFTNDEVAAVGFTGENVPDDQLIFTEPEVGNGLVYYNQLGIAIVRPVYQGWTGDVRNIYFNKSYVESERTIQKTIRSQIVDSSYESERYLSSSYIFTTKRLSERGVNLESLTYPETPPKDFYNSFDQGYNRVYHSGNGLLYKDS